MIAMVKAHIYTKFLNELFSTSSIGEFMGIARQNGLYKVTLEISIKSLNLLTIQKLRVYLEYCVLSLLMRLSNRAALYDKTFLLEG